MSLELLKLIVQPVALERDENGAIIGEKLGEPVLLYSFDQLLAFREGILNELAQQSERRENGDAGAGSVSSEHQVRQPEVSG